ncbi:MAG: hypothetical protein RLZZ594_439, partial [Actinomycetota bacterium]
FESNGYADDDGSANPELIKALAAFAEGQVTIDSVIDRIRESRLLVPLVANLGESEVGAHGQVVDKSADLAIVTVKGPDGQTAMPVFSSVDAMKRWNPEARALAAASELTNRIVLDPGSETEFVIRRPAIAAIAQSIAWKSPEEIPAVHEAFSKSIEGENDVFAFALMQGDPLARLLSAELVVLLRVRQGLEKEQVEEMLERVTTRWSESEVLAKLVDSMTLKLVPAAN